MILTRSTTEALVAADVTVDVVTPIVQGITGVLVDATAEINLLVGADAEVILASADGSAQVTVTVIAQLIAALIVVSPLLYLYGGHLLIILNISQEICGAIGVIINLGHVVALNAIVTIFASLG